AAEFFAISATVAALAHRAGLASASTQISASVRVARREPIMVPMNTIFPIGQRPAGQSSRLDRHHVQLGFLLAVRTGDPPQDRLRDPPIEPEELVVPERRPAVEQAPVVWLPADEVVLPVVVPERVR